MSNLIVIAFQNEADAFEMRATLVKLQSQYLICTGTKINA